MKLLSQLETLYKDENPIEDGVPVETYGYEATHNRAIRAAIALIRTTLSGDAKN